MEQEKQQQKILIVEDDIFLADLLTARFKKDGLLFTLAKDAEDALVMIKKEKPVLILLDLVLPGMGGYEFLEKIKTDKETASIPVIILSNLGQESEFKKGIELGAEDFLVKAHFDLSEISERVKLVLKDIKTKVD